MALVVKSELYSKGNETDRFTVSTFYSYTFYMEEVAIEGKKRFCHTHYSVFLYVPVLVSTITRSMHPHTYEFVSTYSTYKFVFVIPK